MLRQLAMIVSILFVFSAGAAAVSAQDWENLGSKEVKDRSEQDTWHIGNEKGLWKQLKIAVAKRQVRFYRVRVTFSNGQEQEVNVRALIPAGGQTRALDLNGTDRHINKVDIWYEAYTAGRGVRSVVTLWGKR